MKALVPWCLLTSCRCVAIESTVTVTVLLPLEQVTQPLPSRYLPEMLSCQHCHVFSLNYGQKRCHGNARQPAHSHCWKNLPQIMTMFNIFHQENVKVFQTQVRGLFCPRKQESGVTIRRPSTFSKIPQAVCRTGEGGLRRWTPKLPASLLHLHHAHSTALARNNVLSFSITSLLLSIGSVIQAEAS